MVDVFITGTHLHLERAMDKISTEKKEVSCHGTRSVIWNSQAV